MLWMLGVVVLLAATLPEPVLAALAWERQALADGEWWRLWTAHVVHFGAGHALANGGALLLLAVWQWRAAVPQVSTAWRVGRGVAWGLAPVGLSLALLPWAPQMGSYRGASGLVALALSGLAVRWLLAGQRRGLAAALLGLLMGKVLVDAVGGGGSSLPATVVVAWQVHVLGAVLGAVGAVVERLGMGKARVQ